VVLRIARERHPGVSQRIARTEAQGLGNMSLDSSARPIKILANAIAE
jgi:hypothetical protein